MSMIVIIPLVIAIGFLAWVLRPGKKPANTIRIAILVTAALAVAIAVAAVAIQLLHNVSGAVEVSDISNTLFIVGLGLIGTYILAAMGFIVARKADIAKAIGFGICIAVVVSVIELGLLEWLSGV
jgi:hypothetical protein